MEKEGQAINAIGKFIKLLFKAALYLFWGVCRIAEVTLSEINKLLKRILEHKKN